MPGLNIPQPILQNRHQLRPMPHDKGINITLIQIRMTPPHRPRGLRLPWRGELMEIVFRVRELDRQDESTGVFKGVLGVGEGVEVEAAGDGVDGAEGVAELGVLG